MAPRQNPFFENSFDEEFTHEDELSPRSPFMMITTSLPVYESSDGEDEDEKELLLEFERQPQHEGSPTKKFKEERLKVTFGSLTIREHVVIEGDHPCCRFPPALELGWEISKETWHASIDQYEALKAPSGSVKEDGSQLGRRSRQELRLSAETRRLWLGQDKKVSQKSVRRLIDNTWMHSFREMPHLEDVGLPTETLEADMDLDDLLNDMNHVEHSPVGTIVDEPTWGQVLRLEV